MKYSIILLFFLFSCIKNYSVYTECSKTEKVLIDWRDIENFEYYISKRENTANIIIKKWEHENTPLGVYYGNGIIYANNDYRTIAHEIGHFLGYIHSENSNSIMYKYHIDSAVQFIDLRR